MVELRVNVRKIYRRLSLIHGKSSDPVFIKKIKLKIWTLRDEIEAVILKATELKGSALTDQEKTSLIDEYCPKNVVPPTLKVIDGGGESEEKQADSAEEGEAGEEDSKEKAEALLEAMDGGDSEENKEGDGELFNVLPKIFQLIK